MTGHATMKVLPILAALLPGMIAPSTAPAAPPPDDSPAGSERAREMFRRFPSRGQLSDLSVPPRSPEEAVRSFTVADGLEVDCVLHEPLVRQPVFLNFDERGRLWVVQLIQYPYPAGIKVMDLDHQFHATYDQVPPPPPYPEGSPFRGRSKITLHEDTDGDGAFDRHSVFLDGLSMATAVEWGRGGVWVLQAPYLLFYPDADRDDRPDADPVVHLSGFGMEDTHSTANSLRWGADGWLYGAHGSGCSSTIRRPGEEGEGFYFKGQAVWRYHPVTRRFELFAEGGGNTYGLEFDAEGRVFSGHNGGDTRGFHYVQGGYYVKGWGEHGYLTNPHAFGWFGAIQHDKSVPRFSHTLIVYEAGALGAKYEGRLLCPVPLHNVVMRTERIPDGSTYRTRDEGKLLSSDDRWFRPVDIKAGPDGAVYIADWYDTRLSHMNPQDTWDKERGRVYRVRAKASDRSKNAPFDLAKKSAADLADLLQHPNPWHRRQALRLLADRRDAAAVPLLRKALDQDGPRAVDALWGLFASGGFGESALAALRHGHPSVRREAVRLLGDPGDPVPVTEEVRRRLVEMARTEPDAQTRGQLASTSKRLPADAALPILDALLRRAEDANDPHIPLLAWWALEAKAVSHRDAVVGLFQDKALWEAPLIRKHVLERLARRYAAQPAPENQAALARLLKSAPDDAAREIVVKGIQEAYRGRKIEGLLASIDEALQPKAGGKEDPEALAFAVRRGDARAVAAAIAAVSAGDAGPADARLRLVEALGDAHPPEAVPVLVETLGRPGDRGVRIAALAALARYEDPTVAQDILAHWSGFDVDLRGRAVDVLCRRKAWAKTLLDEAVGRGAIPRQDISDEAVERIRLLGDDELTKLADRYFGRPARATSDAKRKRIEEVAAVLAKGAGDPAAGQPLFAARCAACHTLFGEGGKVGPDLTGYERTNREMLLLAIVDPSAAIREGFVQHVVNTDDGRVLVGLIAERDADRMVLVDARGERTAVPLAEVESQKMMETSMMPEGLLDGLDEKALRDLFAWLGFPNGLSKERGLIGK
jgi:putative membrane-bound dehydrogenase-like protein